MTYKDFFGSKLLKQIKSICCLKTLVCFLDIKEFSYNTLLALTGLASGKLEETLERLIARGMMTKLETGMYKIGGTRSTYSSDNKVFEFCDKLDCTCRAKYYGPYKETLKDLMKRESERGWEHIKGRRKGPFQDLLNLFYSLTGGESPSIKKELFTLKNLSKKYTLSDIEEAIKYAAEKQKIYTVTLLPYIMNEALAQKGLLTDKEASKTKPLSELNRLQLCYEVQGEHAARKQFGEDKVNKFLKLIKDGKVKIGLKDKLKFV